MNKYTIFTLGNDVVLDWLIGFFNSLRSINTTVKVKVIPFDDRIAKLKNLRESFDFEIVEHSSLQDLEEIGTRFWDGNIMSGKTWRKLACFTVQDDPFIFMDSDIVFTENPDTLYDIYASSDSAFMCFDIDETQVYKRGLLRDFMKQKYNSRSFNSGCFISKGSTFSIDEIREVASGAYSKKKDFLGWGDQTFINYLLDTSEINVSVFSEVDKSYSPSTWAKNSIIDKEGKVFTKGKPMPFIHWAGYDIGFFMPSKSVYQEWRLHGAFKKDTREVRLRFLRSLFSIQLIKLLLKNLVPQGIKNYLKNRKYSDH